MTSGLEDKYKNKDITSPTNGNEFNHSSFYIYHSVLYICLSIILSSSSISLFISFSWLPQPTTRPNFANGQRSSRGNFCSSLAPCTLSFLTGPFVSCFSLSPWTLLLFFFTQLSYSLPSLVGRWASSAHLIYLQFTDHYRHHPHHNQELSIMLS